MTDRDCKSIVAKPTTEVAPIRPGARAIVGRMVTNAMDILRRREGGRHSIGDYEFRDPDYQQILIWAEATTLSPEVLVATIRQEGLDVADGAIVCLRWGFAGVELYLSHVPSLEVLDCTETAPPN